MSKIIIIVFLVIVLVLVFISVKFFNNTPQKEVGRTSPPNVSVNIDEPLPTPTLK